MVVYNLSIKVNHDVAAEWIAWQIKQQIPETMATGLFTNFNFFKLLTHDDEEGLTYVIQYYTNTMENYNRFINEFAPLLEKKALEKWNDKFIIFRSLMETVQ